MRIISLLILFFAFHSLLLAQDEFSHDFTEGAYTYSDEIPKEKRKGKAKKKKDYKGYKKLKNDFKLFCQFLHEDGRGKIFAKILEKNRGTKHGCLLCKDFIKALSTGCRAGALGFEKKLKKIRKRHVKEAEQRMKELEKEFGEDSEEVAQVEEEIAQIKKQDLPEPKPSREPRLQAIDQTSRLFRALSEDIKNIADIYKALKYLLTLLEGDSNLKVKMTVGEREYYAILGSYMSYPFQGYIEYEERETKRLEQERKERERREQFLLDD